MKKKKPSCCKFIIYVIFFFCVSELFRKFIYRETREDCTVKYYTEIFLMAKREMFLNKREKYIYDIVDDTLKELIKLQLALDLKNGSVLHRTYDKLQRYSIMMNSSMNETYLENSHEYKNVPISLEEQKRGVPKGSFLGKMLQNKKLVASKNSNETLYSCPETYNGSLYGYPEYTKGFVRERCEREPFSKTISLILDRPISDTKYIQAILDKTKNVFKNIFLIVSRKETKPLSRIMLWNNVKVHLYQSGYKELGAVLNSIIKQVTSPFVLVASQITEYTILETDLERLVSAYIETKAHVVGAARKNYQTGEWRRNCYQSSLKMYSLKYTESYDSSKNECLRCDYVNSSFLTSLKNLQSVSFNANLSYGVFDDFFLRLKMLNGRVFTCPDVMFYGYDSKLDNSKLVRFAKEWDIRKIIHPDKSVYWFGCRAGDKYTSTKKCPFRKGMAVPPCCLENLKNSLDYLFMQCELNSITCQLQEGSVLGMVKFKGLLPWERDADIRINSEDIIKLQKLTDEFKENGYELVTDEEPKTKDNITHGGVLHIRAHGWSVQIYGFDNVTTTQRKKKRIKTKMKLKNKWIYLPENPGQYSRNRYGAEMYKHAEHWMSSGQKSSWDEYKSGRFQKCTIPGHHACLDQFEADGDINFIDV